MRNCRSGAAWWVGAAFVLGCGPAEPGAPAPKDPGGPKSSNITVTIVSPEEVQKELDRFHKDRKVVLVDFWATWCLPCRANFPHTMELRRKYAADGLAVVTIALEDDPSGGAEEVVKFLREQQSETLNLMSGLALEESFEKFDIDGGALPHYRIYGRNGALAKKFVWGDPDHPFDHTDVEAAVKAALEEKTP